MEKKLVFKVLNWDFNARKAEMYNIFNNCVVSRRVEESVKEYLKNPNKFEYERGFGENAKKYKGREAIKEQIDQIIMGEEWSRREYEIAVADLFEEKPENFEKWDCYSQAHANIDLITDMCINFYKENK